MDKMASPGSLKRMGTIGCLEDFFRENGREETKEKAEIKGFLVDRY